MAFLFDTNVWGAAVLSTHPAHQVAREALHNTTPAAPAVWCRATQQSFLRLITTTALLKAYQAPDFTNRDALAALDALQALPQVCERDEQPRTVAIWRRLADRETASPKVWMDAYLAAFALAGGLRLVTLDQDFRTFTTEGLDLLLL